MSEPSYEDSLILKNGVRENPAAHSHTEIKAVFDGMNPAEASYARDDYAAIATGWEETVEVFAARIRRSSESAWEGPAAEKARRAIGDYATDAMILTPALHGLAARVDNMVAAVLSTKNGMPEVVDDPQSWWNPGDWFDGDGGVSAAEQGARQHMTTNYVDPAVSVDAQVPVLPQPRGPVAVDNGGVPGGTGAGAGTGGSGPGPAGSSPGPGTPGPETPGTEQPVGEEQTTGGEAAPGDTQSPTIETAGTTPQPTAPSTTGSPAVTPASTTTGTPPGISGSPGGPAGSPGPGSPGPGAPGPGGTVQGSPGTATPAAAAGAGSASGSPAGRGGAPMMGAPGARGGGSGDDDRDRQTPDYLINDENTRELLGADPPALPGGVLGADVPAARPDERPPGR